MRSRRSTVAQQIFALQTLTVLLVVAVATVLAVVDARAAQLGDARTRTVAIAQAVADSPAVLAALRTADPSVRIQPFAETVRTDTDTDFVVVMALDRTRYSHPNPELIGKPFIGDLGDAPVGGDFTQQYTGTLGPSMRAVVPVLDREGTVVALVSVGITLQRISAAVWDRLLRIGLVAPGLLALGAVGAWLISRRLRRQTHGMGAREITRMYEYYDAVLHAVREGLVLLDDRHRVQLANDEAVRLLALPPDFRGRDLDDPRACRRPWCSRWPSGTPDPTRSTSSTTTSCWSTRPRPGGRAASWARWSPSATTPSCRPSPGSWTPSGGWPSRSGPRPTRPPTVCTPWSR